MASYDVASSMLGSPWRTELCEWPFLCWGIARALELRSAAGRRGRATEAAEHEAASDAMMVGGGASCRLRRGAV